MRRADGILSRDGLAPYKKCALYRAPLTHSNIKDRFGSEADTLGHLDDVRFVR